MVEGYCGNKVMQDMCLNDAVHEEGANESQFTINSCSCSALEVPDAVLVMRKGRIGVLKVSNGNYSRLALLALWIGETLTEPVVYPKIRHEIPHGQIPPAITRTKPIQECSSTSKADITEQDQLGVLFIDKRR